ncbi:MAG TPA: hypothetical protein EYG11_15985 [Candidatus Latescibacteria bacterium]|nr:hypothetical protein [Candidatus Handelsmanbacteria bacterium]HIL10199.1 hypothetical protein [Candidatus Latescibacterota bacterium]
MLVNTVTAGEIRTFAQLEIPPDESEVQIRPGRQPHSDALKNLRAADERNTCAPQPANTLPAPPDKSSAEAGSE